MTQAMHWNGVERRDGLDRRGLDLPWQDERRSGSAAAVGSARAIPTRPSACSVGSPRPRCWRSSPAGPWTARPPAHGVLETLAPKHERHDAIPSTAAIAGHPLHPAVVPLPIGALTGALAADVAYAATNDPFFARAGRLLTLVGLVTGALARGARRDRLLVEAPDPLAPDRVVPRDRQCGDARAVGHQPRPAGPGRPGRDAAGRARAQRRVRRRPHGDGLAWRGALVPPSDRAHPQRGGRSMTDRRDDAGRGGEPPRPGPGLQPGEGSGRLGHRRRADDRTAALVPADARARGGRVRPGRSDEGRSLPADRRAAGDGPAAEPPIRARRTWAEGSDG